MSAIRQRMIEDMQLHGYSAKTQTAYLGAVRGLAGHYHRTPEDITQDELRSYFLYLVKERGVARSTLTIHLCGIKFSSRKPSSGNGSSLISFALKRGQSSLSS